ncbi:MAG: hypothetical protein ACI4IR_06465, partial [Eubacterium sp.]
MKRKSALSKLNIFLSIVLVACIVATVVVVSRPDKVTEAVDASAETDEVVIDEFAAGTYAGIEFKAVEDVINFYKEAYDYSKTLTA